MFGNIFFTGLARGIFITVVCYLCNSFAGWDAICLNSSGSEITPSLNSQYDDCRININNAVTGATNDVFRIDIAPFSSGWTVDFAGVIRGLVGLNKSTTLNLGFPNKPDRAILFKHRGEIDSINIINVNHTYNTGSGDLDGGGVQVYNNISNILTSFNTANNTYIQIKNNAIISGVAAINNAGKIYLDSTSSIGSTRPMGIFTNTGNLSSTSSATGTIKVNSLNNSGTVDIYNDFNVVNSITNSGIFTQRKGLISSSSLSGTITNSGTISLYGDASSSASSSMPINYDATTGGVVNMNGGTCDSIVDLGNKGILNFNVAKNYASGEFNVSTINFKASSAESNFTNSSLVANKFNNYNGVTINLKEGSDLSGQSASSIISNSGNIWIEGGGLGQNGKISTFNNDSAARLVINSNDSKVSIATLNLAKSTIASNNFAIQLANKVEIDTLNSLGGAIDIASGNLVVTNAIPLLEGRFGISGGIATLDDITNFKATLTANSSANLTIGSITAATGTINASGGTITLDGIGALTGSIKVNGGTLTSVGKITKSSPGTLSVSGGTLNLAELENLSGDISISGGTANIAKVTKSLGQLEISGGTTNLREFNNTAGNIVISGGTTNISTLNKTVGTLYISNGTVNITQLNNAANKIAIIGGTTTITELNKSLGDLNIAAGNVNVGTINNTGGNIYVSSSDLSSDGDSGVIINAAGKTMQFKDAATIGKNNLLDQIQNSGILQLYNSSAHSASLNNRLNTLTNQDSGVTHFKNGTLNLGTINNQDTAIINLYSGSMQVDQCNNQSVINISGGDLSSQVTSYSSGNPQFSGSSALINTGTINLNTGTIGKSVGSNFKFNTITNNNILNLKGGTANFGDFTQASSNSNLNITGGVMNVGNIYNTQGRINLTTGIIKSGNSSAKTVLNNEVGQIITISRTGKLGDSTDPTVGLGIINNNGTITCNGGSMYSSDFNNLDNSANLNINNQAVVTTGNINNTAGMINLTDGKLLANIEYVPASAGVTEKFAQFNNNIAQAVNIEANGSLGEGSSSSNLGNSTSRRISNYGAINSSGKIYAIGFTNYNSGTVMIDGILSLGIGLQEPKVAGQSTTYYGGVLENYGQLSVNSNGIILSGVTAAVKKINNYGTITTSGNITLPIDFKSPQGILTINGGQVGAVTASTDQTAANQVTIDITDSSTEFDLAPLSSTDPAETAGANIFKKISINGSSKAALKANYLNVSSNLSTTSQAELTISNQGKLNLSGSGVLFDNAGTTKIKDANTKMSIGGTVNNAGTINATGGGVSFNYFNNTTAGAALNISGIAATVENSINNTLGEIQLEKAVIHSLAKSPGGASSYASLTNGANQIIEVGVASGLGKGFDSTKTYLPLGAITNAGTINAAGYIVAQSVFNQEGAILNLNHEAIVQNIFTNEGTLSLGTAGRIKPFTSPPPLATLAVLNAGNITSSGDIQLPLKFSSAAAGLTLRAGSTKEITSDDGTTNKGVVNFNLAKGKKYNITSANNNQINLIKTLNLASDSEVSVARPLNLSDNLTLAANAELTVATGGDVSGKPTVENAGQLNLAGSSVNTFGSGFNRGIITASDTSQTNWDDFTNNQATAELNLTGGRVKVLSLNNTAGQINVSAGDLSSADPANPAAVTNEKSQIITISGTGTLGANGALGLVTNSGTVTAEGGDLVVTEFLNDDSGAQLNLNNGQMIVKTKLNNHLGKVKVNGVIHSATIGSATLTNGSNQVFDLGIGAGLGKGVISGGTYNPLGIMTNLGVMNADGVIAAQSLFNREGGTLHLNHQTLVQNTFINEGTLNLGTTGKIMPFSTPLPASDPNLALINVGSITSSGQIQLPLKFSSAAAALTLRAGSTQLISSDLLSENKGVVNFNLAKGKKYSITSANNNQINLIKTLNLASDSEVSVARPLNLSDNLTLAANAELTVATGGDVSGKATVDNSGQLNLAGSSVNTFGSGFNRGIITASDTSQTSWDDFTNNQTAAELNLTGGRVKVLSLNNTAGQINVSAGDLSSADPANPAAVTNEKSQIITISGTGTLGANGSLGLVTNSGTVTAEGGDLVVTQFLNDDSGAQLNLSGCKMIVKTKFSNHLGKVKLENGVIHSLTITPSGGSATSSYAELINGASQSIDLGVSAGLGQGFKSGVTYNPLGAITNLGVINADGVIAAQSLFNRDGGILNLNRKTLLQNILTNEGTLNLALNAKIMPFSAPLPSPDANLTVFNAGTITSSGEIQVPLKFSSATAELTLRAGSTIAISSDDTENKGVVNFNLAKGKKYNITSANNNQINLIKTLNLASDSEVSVARPLNLSDNLTLAANAELTVATGGDVSGKATVDNSGQLNLAGSSNNTFGSGFNRGIITASDTSQTSWDDFTNNQTAAELNLTGGRVKVLSLNNTAGQINVSAGDLSSADLANPAAVTNEKSQIITISGTGTIGANGILGVVTNYGTVAVAGSLFFTEWLNDDSAAALNLSNGMVVVKKAINNNLGKISLRRGVIFSDSSGNPGISSYANLTNGATQVIDLGSSAALGGFSASTIYRPLGTITNLGTINADGIISTQSLCNYAGAILKLNNQTLLQDVLTNEGTLTLGTSGKIMALPSPAGTLAVANAGSITSWGEIQLPLKFSSATAELTLKAGNTLGISSDTAENKGVVNFNLAKGKKYNITSTNNNQINLIKTLNLASDSEVSVARPLNLSDNLTLAANAELTVATGGDVSGKATVDNSGQLNLAGSSVNTFGSGFNRGVITASDTSQTSWDDFTNNQATAELNLTGGRVKVLSFSNTAGQVNVSAGDLSSADPANPAAVTNEKSQTITISGTGTLGANGALGVVKNLGTLEAQGGDLTLTEFLNDDLAAQLNLSSGKMAVKSKFNNNLGKVKVENAVIHSTTVTPAGGSATSSYAALINGANQVFDLGINAGLGKGFDPSVTYRPLGTITNLGTMNADGVIQTSNLVNQGSGRLIATNKINVSNTTSNSGVIDFNGYIMELGNFVHKLNDFANSSPTLKISKGNAIIGNIDNINGEINLIGGDLSSKVVNGSTIHNYPNQTIKIEGNASLGNYGSFGAVTNEGMIKADGGNISWSSFSNNFADATLNISSGIVYSGDLNNSLGSITISGGEISQRSGGTTTLTNASKQQFNLVDNGKLGYTQEITQINNYGFFNADGIATYAGTINNRADATFLINNDATISNGINNYGNLKFKLDAKVNPRANPATINNFGNIFLTGQINLPVVNAKDPTLPNPTITINGGKFTTITGNNNAYDTVKVDLIDDKVLALNGSGTNNTLVAIKNLQVQGKSQVDISSSQLNLPGQLTILDSAQVQIGSNGQLLRIANLDNYATLNIAPTGQLGATSSEVNTISNYGIITAEGNISCNDIINQQTGEFNLDANVTILRHINNHGRFILRENSQINPAVLANSGIFTNSNLLDISGSLNLPINFGNTGGTIVFRQGIVKTITGNSGEDVLNLNLLSDEVLHLNHSSGQNNLDVNNIKNINIQGKSKVQIDLGNNLNVSKSFSSSPDATIALAGKLVGGGDLVNAGKISLVAGAKLGSIAAISGISNSRLNKIDNQGEIKLDPNSEIAGSSLNNQALGLIELSGVLDLTTELVNDGKIKLDRTGVIQSSNNISILNKGEIDSNGSIALPILLEGDNATLILKEAPTYMVKTITGLEGKTQVNLDVLAVNFDDTNSFKDIYDLTLQAFIAQSMNPPQDSIIELRSVNTVRHKLTIGPKNILNISPHGDLSGGADLYNQGKLSTSSTNSIRGISAGSIGSTVPMGILYNTGIVNFEGEQVNFKEIRNNSHSASIVIQKGNIVAGKYSNDLGVINITGGDLSSIDPTNLSDLSNAAGQAIYLSNPGTIGANLLLGKVENAGKLTLRGNFYARELNNLNLGILTLGSLIQLGDNLNNAGVMLVEHNGEINAKEIINVGQIISNGAINAPIKLLNNTGTVTIKGGSIAGINGGGAEETINFALNGGNVALTHPITNVNIFNLKQGNLDVTTAITGMKKHLEISTNSTITLGQNGDVSGGGKINNYGQLNIDDPGATLGKYAPLGSITNYGTLTANGGDLKFGSMINQPNATWSITTGDVTVGLDGSNLIVNKGTLNIGTTSFSPTVYTTLSSPISYTTLVNAGIFNLRGNAKFMPAIASGSGKLGNVINTGIITLSSTSWLGIYGELINNDLNTIYSLPQNTKFNLKNGTVKIQDGIKNNLGTITIGDPDHLTLTPDLSSQDPVNPARLFNGNNQLIQIVGQATIGQNVPLGKVINHGIINANGGDLFLGDFRNDHRTAQLNLSSGTISLRNIKNNVGIINLSGDGDLSSIVSADRSNLFNAPNQFINIYDQATLGKRLALGNIENKGEINADGGNLRLRGNIVNNSTIASLKIKQGVVCLQDVFNQAGKITIGDATFPAKNARIVSIDPAKPSSWFNYNDQVINVVGSGKIGSETNPLEKMENKGQINIDATGDALYLGNFTNQFKQALLNITKGNVYVAALNNILGTVIIGDLNTSGDLSSLNQPGAPIYNHANQTIKILGNGTLGASGPLGDVYNYGNFYGAGGDLILGHLNNNGLHASFTVEQGTVFTGHINNNLGKIKVTGGELSSNDPTVTSDVINGVNQEFTVISPGTMGKINQYGAISNNGTMTLLSSVVKAQDFANNGLAKIGYKPDQTVSGAVNLANIYNHGILTLSNEGIVSNFVINQIYNDRQANIVITGPIMLQQVFNAVEANLELNLDAKLTFETPTSLENYGIVNVLRPADIIQANYVVKEQATHIANFDNGTPITLNLHDGNCAFEGNCILKIRSNGALNFKKNQVYPLIIGTGAANLSDDVQIISENPLVQFKLIQIPAQPEVVNVTATLAFAPNPNLPHDAIDRLAPELGDLTALSLDNLGSVLGANQARLVHLVHNKINQINTGMTGYSAGGMQAKDRIWLKSFGSHGSQRPLVNFNGYKANSYGLTMGTDTEITNNIWVGISGSVVKSKVNNKELSKTSKIQSYQTTLYGSYKYNNYYVDTFLTLGLNRYKVFRSMSWAGVNAQGKFNGTMPAAKLNGGYIHSIGNWQFIPHMEMQYGKLKQNEYTETGAGIFNATGSASSSSQLALGSGLRLSLMHYTSDLTLFNPSASFMLVYDLVKHNRGGTTITFSNGEQFNVASSNPSKIGYNFELNLNILQTNKINLTASYEVKLKQKFISHHGALALRYQL